MDEATKAFLDRFDAYATARAQLSALPESGHDTNQQISHCASLWNSLCRARAAVSASTNEVPK